jgi:LmbE family N-acetylglucosaminyl deacetylase
MQRFLFIALILFVGFAAEAQVRPVYDRGSTGLIQTLKRLNTSASALMIGAHPDDEDTALLAYLARSENARTAYLSLTRGDGGQNIIGPELGEALGLIRTEELLQARNLDGAEQFFTRAYDYGFSKTLTEAKGKWDEKIILCDAVRVIRHFRPMVVISQFSGTPADGHGQHQFAGYIAPISVNAAGDPAQCTSSGPIWKISKFYVRHRGSGEARLSINTGSFDPVLGRSYFEIAMEARSQHKSQEQGVLELRGAQFSGMDLVGSEAVEKRVFAGLDVSIAGFATSIGVDSEGKKALDDMQSSANAAIDGLSVILPEKIIPNLAKGYAAAVRVASSANPAAMAFFELKRKQFADAIILAGGVQLDALADRETVAVGEKVFVGARAFTPSAVVKAKRLFLTVPPTWEITDAAIPKSNSAAFVTREAGDLAAYFELTAPANFQPTQPYWLETTRDGDLFRWDPAEVEAHTLPFARRDVKLVAILDAAGTEIRVERPIEYRYADDVRGEIRRNVDVVPLVSVAVDPGMLIIPFSPKTQSSRISLTVTNHSSKPISGSASLSVKASPEWRQTTQRNEFSFSRPGERAAFPFEITIPAGTKPGDYRIVGTAMIGETASSSTMRTVSYPHIQTHRYYRPAEVSARVIDVKIEPIKVGYIVGSGDRVPEAIRQMGFDLETISENDLANGDLSKFDAIVVGIRAYQVRPDLVANNARILNYTREGGTLIVQYQLPAYAQQRLTPFPTQMGPRVSEENAAIKILIPEHEIFNSPNKINQADFEGWVQERNLYNFTGFGPEYKGLLESHDTGEPENNGGLVAARLGKGTYIYTSYSFFRQLPAGVSGAYRLFANIISSAAIGKPK